MDNSEEKKPIKNPWVTDGIIIAISSIVAYILRYSLEIGYTSAFSIPSWLINIDLISILPLTIVILCLIAFSYYLLILMSYVENIIIIRIGASLTIGLFLTPLVVISLLKGYKEVFYIISLSWLTAMVRAFIIPLLREKQVKGYRAKIEADERRMSVTDRLDRFIGWRFTMKPSSFFIVTWIFLAFILYAYLIGDYAANTKKEFLVIKSSPEKVVLRIYGDKLVCAPFDRTTKEVKRIYNVFKISEDSNLQLYLEEVGPLRLEKEPNTEK